MKAHKGTWAEARGPGREQTVLCGRTWPSLSEHFPVRCLKRQAVSLPILSFGGNEKGSLNRYISPHQGQFRPPSELNEMCAFLTPSWAPEIEAGGDEGLA